MVINVVPFKVNLGTHVYQSVPMFINLAINVHQYGSLFPSILGLHICLHVCYGSLSLHVYNPGSTCQHDCHAGSKCVSVHVYTVCNLKSTQTVMGYSLKEIN